MRRLDALYLEVPFYGSRRMVEALRRDGIQVGRHRVRRLMRLMGLEALAPKPGTSRPAPGHRIYPYLLRGLAITRPNQVWAADITYIPMARGFLYLVAIIDWFSRAVLAWRLSNTMDAAFCVEALEAALARFGAPEIFNTDQGGQFTSVAFTGRLEPASAPGSSSTTIAARTRRSATGRRWRSGAATGPRLRTCRYAWTTLTRCPHAHSRHNASNPFLCDWRRKRCRLPP